MSDVRCIVARSVPEAVLAIAFRDVLIVAEAKVENSGPNFRREKSENRRRRLIDDITKGELERLEVL